MEKYNEIQLIKKWTSVIEKCPIIHPPPVGSA